MEVVSKMDAARRQLATAIELWFYDKDQVSIQSLSYAAYEVIHTLSQKQGRTEELLYDSLVVKDEHRSEYAKFLKKTPSFLKHADRDPPDATTELHPALSELFIMFSIKGLFASQAPLNKFEFAFMWWISFNRPEMLTDQGVQAIRSLFPVDQVANYRGLSKIDFLHMCLQS